MVSKPKTDSENPEWTETDFAQAQGPEALPSELLTAFPNTNGRSGRPRGSTKQAVSIRLDIDVLEKFKATGPGWQSRINDVLKRAEI
jgi:uncharacterized protein (DUF4415 family)